MKHLTFAQKLKAAREAKGLTERDVALLMHSRAPLIRSWEAGKAEPAKEIQERLLADIKAAAPPARPKLTLAGAPRRRAPGGGRPKSGKIKLTVHILPATREALGDKPGEVIDALVLSKLA